MPTIDELLALAAARGMRLVALRDESVVGKARWEALFHSKSEDPRWMFEARWACRGTASEAVEAAMAVEPSYIVRMGEVAAKPEQSEGGSEELGF